jgi:hypothetical protein
MNEETKKVFDSLKGGLPSIRDDKKGIRRYEVPNTNFDFDHPPTQVHDDIQIAETVAPVIPKGTPEVHHAKPIEPTHFDLRKGGEANTVSMGEGHRYVAPPEATTRIFQNYEAQVWQPDEITALPAEPDYFTMRKAASEVIKPSNPPSIPSNAWPSENRNTIKDVGVNRFKAPKELADDFFPTRRPRS